MMKDIVTDEDEDRRRVASEIQIIVADVSLKTD